MKKLLFFCALFTTSAITSVHAERMLVCGSKSEDFDSQIKVHQGNDGQFFINYEKATVILSKNGGEYVLAFRNITEFTGIEIIAVNFETSTIDTEVYGTRLKPIYGVNCRRID